MNATRATALAARTERIWATVLLLRTSFHTLAQVFRRTGTSLLATHIPGFPSSQTPQNVLGSVLMCLAAPHHLLHIILCVSQKHTSSAVSLSSIQGDETTR
eukprot:1549193-Pyramimonas_sp.AAC.1